MNRIKLHLEAGTPCIWINTHEYKRALNVLNDLLKNEMKTFRIWSITKGIHSIDNEPLTDEENKAIDEAYNDMQSTAEIPLEFLLNEKISTTVLALLDYHRFLDDPFILRKLLDVIEDNKFNQVVIISPVTSIPVEVEKYVTIVDLQLPTIEELEEKLIEIVEEESFNEDFKEKLKKDKSLRKKLARAGRGLTLVEFEEAISISLKDKDIVDIKDIFEQKKQLIKKTSGLELFDPEDIDEVKGLETAKTYITKAINSGIGKGSLLVGIPGTGKSLLAKQIGKITGLPTIVLDLGAVFGSLVGESERKISHALKTVEAMAPCILFIDELEKGLSGINSSDRTDGGTGARVFGKFLTWLNDKNSGVYVIATANDISKLPPEFTRSGRWNWIFFVDLPNKEEREEMLKYYCNKYNVEYEDVNTEGFTGAEIKALVENAFILECSLKEAKNSVIPISETRKEEIEYMRNMAKGRFIPASTTYEDKKSKVRKRKLASI